MHITVITVYQVNVLSVFALYCIISGTPQCTAVWHNDSSLIASLWAGGGWSQPASLTLPRPPGRLSSSSGPPPSSSPPGLLSWVFHWLTGATVRESLLLWVCCVQCRTELCWPGLVAPYSVTAQCCSCNGVMQTRECVTLTHITLLSRSNTCHSWKSNNIWQKCYKSPSLLLSFLFIAIIPNLIEIV